MSTPKPMTKSRYLAPSRTPAKYPVQHCDRSSLTELVGGPRLVTGGVAERYVDPLSPGRPHSECGSVLHCVGPHKGVR